MKYLNRFKLIVCATLLIQIWNSSPVHAADTLQRRSDHPYLTYSDANIARLKQRIANEPMIAEAWLRSAKKPGKITLNGEPVEPTYNKKAKNIHLSIRP